MELSQFVSVTMHKGPVDTDPRRYADSPGLQSNMVPAQSPRYSIETGSTSAVHSISSSVGASTIKRRIAVRSMAPSGA